MAARKKKIAPASVGLAATETNSEKAPREIVTLAERVETDGGAVLATYRDPFGAKWLVLAALPIEKVKATPYQRELSKTHADRLTAVIPKVGRFLDPIIAVRQGDEFWTPNGMHRLAALNKLGVKSVVALVVPEPEVALRILALNTEKPHNLKDKSLEVVRMAHHLAEESETSKRPESDWAFEFEEPAYLTIGLCYEARPRFSGSVYLPVVKRSDEWADVSIAKSMAKRAKRAERLLELDDAVNAVVDKMKKAGLKSAYLKPFIVARINPLRWVRAAKPGEKAPRADFDKTVDKMLASAKGFDVGKVRPQDIAAMGGGPPPEE
jgi:ParB family chromosome partitioning protein